MGWLTPDRWGETRVAPVVDSFAKVVEFMPLAFLLLFSGGSDSSFRMAKPYLHEMSMLETRLLPSV